MARIFMTGLEAGSLDVFDTIVGTPGADFAVSTAEKRTGSYSLYINGGYRVGARLSSMPTEIYVRLGHYAKGMGRNGTLMQLLDPDTTQQLTVIIDTVTMTIIVKRSHDSGTTLASASLPVLLNTWMCLEFHIVISNTGSVEIKCDGTSILSYTGDTMETTKPQISEVLFGCTKVTNMDYNRGYYDDIAINDTSGAQNNSWIGRGGILGLFPSGAGAHTDWDPNTGTNHEAVDEKPHDSDTTYVSTTTVDEVDTYAIADLTNSNYVVSAVQWLAAARLDEAGSAAIKPVLRQGGTDYAGDSIGLDVGYALKKKIYDTAPNGDTWTYAIVNAIEAGVKAS
jgi:hypothetical protein